MLWHELGVALCLVLVIEGIMPFVNPDGVRRMFMMAAQLDNNVLRTVGFSSMLIGLLFLYIVR